MRIVRLVLVLVATLMISFAGAQDSRAQPLVTAEWAKDYIGKPDLVFLDIREESLYKVRHVYGAINFPYLNDAWRVRPLGQNNPRRTEQLVDARMSELGITNDSHVILVHAGRAPTDAQAAAHVYWYFKLLGHEKISIMNGGMVAYILDEGPVESLLRDLPTSDYKSEYNGLLIARLNDIEDGLMGGAIFVDYRTTAYYLGIAKLENVARHGTIPTAKNLPADWFTLDSGAMIRPRDQLRRLYELREIQFSLPHIAFSNTTERAALGWFVASEILGNKNVQLYEAGMREWAASPNRRMHRQINLDDSR